MKKARYERTRDVFQCESPYFYRLKDTTSSSKFEESSGNVMLFHGTDDYNATEILNNRFVNSEYGYILVRGYI